MKKLKLTDEVYKKIPILITKDRNYYTVSIPDNYENFKKCKFSEINFEDAEWHLNIKSENSNDFTFTYSKKKYAKEIAKLVKEQIPNAKIVVSF